MCHVHKEEIAAIAGRGGAKPGDQNYLSGYQGAVNEYMKGLDENRTMELELKRSEWINEGRPTEAQRKKADKNGHSFLRTSAELQYKDMGMRSVIWEFHKNSAGTRLFQMLSWPKNYLILN